MDVFGSRVEQHVDANYWANGDLESVRDCPACRGKVMGVLYSGLEDQEEGIPGSWGLLCCGDCGSLALDPRPTVQAIGKAYRSYYTHLPPDEENLSYRGSGFLWRWIDSYIAHRFRDRTRASSFVGACVLWLLWPLRQQLDYLYRHLSKLPGRVLDIGCGNGAFMLRAKDAGWDVRGVEPDAVAASQAITRGLDVFQGDCRALTDDGAFDMVTLAHVIEHLHDPRGMLGECHRLLKPGGRLWIATPNIHSTGHRLFASAWQPLEVPRHLVMPSANALRRLLEESGFTDVRFHCRGHGSKKRIRASVERATKFGMRGRSVAFWSMLIDVRAAFSPYAAEELIVTARRAVP